MPALAGNIYVVLMCGGSQTRMDGTLDIPKQHVLVDGVPNIVRTVNMLRVLAERALIHIVAPDTEAWRTVVKAGNATTSEPASKLFLESAFAALPRIMPGVIDRYLVLCGDVVWSSEALQALVRPAYVESLQSSTGAVFSTRYVPNIYTSRDSGEIFGFSFPANMRGTMVSTARTCLEASRSMVALADNVQTLTSEQAYNLRERNCRLWFYMHMLEDRALARVVEVAVDDYTDDIDDPKDVASLEVLNQVIKTLAAKGANTHDTP